MASNDEGHGSGDCDDVYRAADEFLSLADETETGAETETGIETGAQTKTGAETSGAGVEPKAKRQRFPNKLRTTRLVVMEVDDGNFETNAPQEARACYGNQLHHGGKISCTCTPTKMK